MALAKLQIKLFNHYGSLSQKGPELTLELDLDGSKVSGKRVFAPGNWS